MTDPILRLDGLCKHFGALNVTDHVSLDVREGEIHAIIGPNGAGKTTLIGQICGALPSDQGRVTFKGRDITALPVHKRARCGLARSFQITNVLPEFTALENVALAVQAQQGHSFRFVRRAASDRALNSEAMACLRRVGLEERTLVRARGLSHGEQRALELAIALAARPKLLLLDEPMAGTGREETDSLIAMLQDLRGQVAMVLVEHDMSAVFALADRISVLVYGRLIATGTPEEIRANADVQAAYLGEEPV
ncbi:ABC transporter ATP-binding protein [Breoghania sp. L-A4]|uniref:ABC transporter ATP-binding protein n=1 Tax=Breoghania sp. L-A4 TaxID=2304600 RepID=UPI000E35EAC6|nr:ABC transporter ATP-binding protein [Breoghania sp. L-A4]AXS40020.1 ABC transporter ATP-binding protein [Breoghania sp. L-A4]